MTDARPSLPELINRQQGKPPHAPLAKGVKGLSDQEQPGGDETPPEAAPKAGSPAARLHGR